jgi:hypothetical protein
VRIKPVALALGAALLATGATAGWIEARYRLDLKAVTDLPTRPQLPPPPAFTVIPAWDELGGRGDPTMPGVYPWRLDLLRQLPAPSEPGLLAARRVAWGYLCDQTWDEPCRADGSVSERQVQALTIWLTRHWTPREVLGAYTYLGQW